MTHREIFTDIYARRVWGDGSGGGSAPGVAGPWAAIASRVIAELAPATVLDVGCGDGWASAGIDLGGAKYIGVDPVEAMHRYCFAVHRRATRSFRCLDAIADELPDADLVLLKEVTQHLSDASVRALIAKLRRYPAVLHCGAWAERLGDNIEDGGYRPVVLGAYGIKASPRGTWQYGGTMYHAELWSPS
jgi:SAM-dependent methyltransferase